MKIILSANTDWFLYNFRLAHAHFLRECGVEMLLISPPGEYAARLQAAGYRWLPVDYSRSGMNPFREIHAVRDLTRLYRRERPDLVHHFTIKPVLYGSLAARLARVPIVINGVTGLGYVFVEDGWKRRLMRSFIQRWYRWALAGTQTIFENAEDCQFFLRKRITTADASHVVNSAGVDVNVFRPVPEPPGTPIVVYVGRMLWDKGVGELVEAARILKRDGVQGRIALVGKTDPGNPSFIPEEQLQAWHAEGVVEYWGWHDNMASVLAEVHIFCMPSYREGLPKAIIEAAASSRPVVASDVPGCRAAVRPGETGLLVPVRDAPALATALKTLLLDAALRQRMGAAGRSLVEAEFSTTRVNEATIRIYAQAGLKGLT